MDQETNWFGVATGFGGQSVLIGNDMCWGLIWNVDQPSQQIWLRSETRRIGLAAGGGAIVSLLFGVNIKSRFDIDMIKNKKDIDFAAGVKIDNIIDIGKFGFILARIKRIEKFIDGMAAGAVYELFTKSELETIRQTTIQVIKEMHATDGNIKNKSRALDIYRLDFGIGPEVGMWHSSTKYFSRNPRDTRR